MHRGAVVEAGVPVAAALRREVHEVPDGSEQVDAALADVGGHPRMRGVEVAQSAIGLAGEKGAESGMVPPLQTKDPEFREEEVGFCRGVPVPTPARPGSGSKGCRAAPPDQV